MNRYRPTVIALVCVLTSGYAAAQYGPVAPLFVAVNIDRYISETYTEPPTDFAGFVFFTGQPIEYKVQAANRQQAAIVLDFPTGVDRAARVTRAVKVDLATGAETPVPLSINIDSVSKLAGALHPAPITDQRAIEFEYKDQVAWHFHLRERLAVGHYRVSVSFLGQDREGRRILPMSEEMRFEVRDAARYPAELLLRQGYRNAEPDGDLNRAERALKRLLVLNPDSSIAYHLLAMVADLRGNAEMARRYRETGAAIATARPDQLRLKYCDAVCRATVRHPP